MQTPHQTLVVQALRNTRCVEEIARGRDVGSTSQQIPRPNGLHVKSRRRFLGMRPRTTSSAIATGSMAASSHADCAPWASGTSLPHQPPSWADFITATPAFKLWVHTPDFAGAESRAPGAPRQLLLNLL
jgi:hypothetical protein